MISIQSVMLVCLGFFIALLLGLLIAPAFWSRAVRLTTQRLKASLPINESEIRADKDRLRAEYAVKVHQLESQIEQAKLAGARQMIELNRRDAEIGNLEKLMGDVRSNLEENQNARRVLEQTITDRLPKVESRLFDAKQLLMSRDQDIAELGSTSQKQKSALDEAAAVIAQHQAEIRRLKVDIATAEARNRGQLRDARYEAEVAMRSEVEALRARARAQSSVIGRLQGDGGPAGNDAGPAAVSPSAGVEAGNVDQLKKDLAAAELSLSQFKDAANSKAALDQEAKTLKGQIVDQTAEIARLQAELTALTDGVKDDRRLSIKDSKLSLKAKLGGLTAKSEQQAETIQRLRMELAASNERSARQANYFMDQMRRLGAGTAAHSEPRTRSANGAGRRSAGERLAPVRAGSSGRGARGPRPSESETSAIKIVAGTATSPSAPAMVAANTDVSRKGSDAPLPTLAQSAGNSAGATAAGSNSLPDTDDPMLTGAGVQAPAPGADATRGSRLIDRLTSLAKN